MMSGAERPAEIIDAQIGKTASLTGVAGSAKTGLLLQTAEGSIYVDGLAAWPEGFEGKTVSVAGKLEERFDLPVFIKKEGVDNPAGIPVPEGTDLKAASRRPFPNWGTPEPGYGSS